MCDEFVVVVDTSYRWSNVRSDLQELRKITDLEVEYVINTHYHPDHAYGNHLYTCPVIAHGECVKLLQEAGQRQIAELLQEEVGNEIKSQLQKSGPRYPTLTFDQTYRIEASPAIEVVHLGGHTPDLSIVRILEEKIVFASDDLFGSEDPSLPSHPYMTTRSDLNQWISALKAILNMEAQIIVPGHFGLCNRNAIDNLIEYLELFISNMKVLKDRGCSKEEIRRNPELLKLPKVGAGFWIENNVEAQYPKL